MSAATIDVDVQCFPPAYLDKADRVFLTPSPLYSWDEIVSGAPVRSQAGAIRRMFAVGQTTFRGFYRVNKACPGAKKGFINYFLDQRSALVKTLSAVRTRNDLNRLSNRICKGVQAKLTNCSPAQLRSYIATGVITFSRRIREVAAPNYPWDRDWTWVRRIAHLGQRRL